MNAYGPRRLALGALPRDPRATEVKASGRRGAEVAAWLRGLVLAHPDLAERLTQAPLGFGQPAQWSGFIPPATTALAPGGSINTSIARTALRGICAEAIRREHGDAEADDWEALS